MSSKGSSSDSDSKESFKPKPESLAQTPLREEVGNGFISIA